ncbi:MAG: hypothetical protein ABSF46_25830 [Terriglobia bacterium]|jgi:hypothetical protein
MNRQPSPLGRGCRAPALSSAGAGRVRGLLQDHQNQSKVNLQSSKPKAIQMANGKVQMANGLGFEKIDKLQTI